MSDEPDQVDAFPLVQFVHGGPSPDGTLLLVEAATTPGTVHFLDTVSDHIEMDAVRDHLRMIADSVRDDATVDASVRRSLN